MSIYRGWEKPINDLENARRVAIGHAMQAMGLKELTITPHHIHAIIGRRLEMVKNPDESIAIYLRDDVQIDGEVLTPRDHRLPDMRDVTPR